MRCGNFYDKCIHHCSPLNDTETTALRDLRPLSRRIKSAFEDPMSILAEVASRQSLCLSVCHRQRQRDEQTDRHTQADKQTKDR